jgi:glyoxylate reductase
MGSIGRQVADILSNAFGAKIIYTNRRKDASSPHEFVSLDELLERSDVISLNCPLTPETTGLIGAKEFAKAKDGVLFVNTARGKVVVEDELVNALKSGKGELALPVPCWTNTP